MGTLRYGSPAQVCTFDDRLLMHLQVVIIAKLRRRERFTLTYTDTATGGRTTLWLSPDIALQFNFVEPARGINPEWVAALARSAADSEGLRVVDEPGSSTSRAHTADGVMLARSPLQRLLPAG